MRPTAVVAFAYIPSSRALVSALGLGITGSGGAAVLMEGPSADEGDGDGRWPAERRERPPARTWPWARSAISVGEGDDAGGQVQGAAGSGRTAHDALQRRHVGVVTTPRRGHAALIDEGAVGGVDIDPAGARGEHAQPGVGGRGTDQIGRAHV